MDRIFNNGIYFAIIAVLFALTGLLNISPKLIVCSGIYVLLALTTNLISESYGKKKALLGLALCILANIILVFENLDLMLMSSFFSVLVSVYFGINLSENLKSKFSFPVRNFIGLAACSVIDSILMSCTLLTKFSVTKSLSIGLGDLMLKFSYSLTASLFVLAIVCLVKQDWKLRHIN
jgi:hypothetical protein